MTTPVDYGEPVLLHTADDVVEADMLLNLLTEHGIPAFKKIRGAGEYLSIYMGVTSLGVQVYVPEQLLTQAREIVEAWLPSKDGAELPEDWEEMAAGQPEYGEAELEYDEPADGGPEEHGEDEEVPLRRDMGRLLLWLWLIGMLVIVLLQVSGFLSTLRELFFG